MTMYLPNNWEPRIYQRPLWDYFMGGGVRASATWHRRAGKDEVSLHWSACAAHMRVGTYWHMLPQANQARKAIWNAVNPHSGIKRIDEAFPHVLRENTRDDEMFIRFKNGSTWQVVGSDNFNALVGSPPVGLTFSEWALANPVAWGMLRPILLENGGWANFIGTPRGHNHAKRTHDLAMKDPAWFGQLLTVDDTHLFTAEQIRMEKAEMISQYGLEHGTALFEQEYYCSFNAAVIGAYFALQMRNARKEGRVSPKVRHIPGLPVHTWWDLGIDDPTAIVFVQFDGPRVLVIDFFQSSGAFMADYVDVLEEKRKEHGYVYGAHIGPHDLNKREFSGQTVKDLAMDLGIEFEVAPKLGKADSIQHVRRTLPRCHFRECEEMEPLIDALEQHHSEYDEKNRVLGINPVHDWTSHPVDAFKYGAQSPAYFFTRTWEDDGPGDEWGTNLSKYDKELDRCAI